MFPAQPKIFEVLTALRQEIHQNPETAYEEIETQQRIIKFLEANFEKGAYTIKPIAKTGLLVDFKGQSPSSSGKPRILAVRADIDALNMPDLTKASYVSKNPNKAHACGHDGHIVCLLGGVYELVYGGGIKTIPSDCTVRCVFQPAEEFNPEGGAQRIIDEGGLEGVSAIFGLHNGTFESKISTKVGFFNASSNKVELTVEGKGGHGSTPEKVNDAMKGLSRVMNRIDALWRERIGKGEEFVFNCGYVKWGTALNAFGDCASVGMSLRCFHEKTIEQCEKELNEVLEAELKDLKLKHSLNLIRGYPAINNTPKETEFLIELGKEYVGKDQVEVLETPFYFGEDFSRYLHVVPGCFFGYSVRDETHTGMLHQSDYDYNDKSTEEISKFWALLMAKYFERI